MYKQSAAVVLGAVVVCLLVNESISANLKRARVSKGEDIKRQLEPLEDCLVGTYFSFLYPASYPAKNAAAFEKQCQFQAENTKCLKEGIKDLGGIIKRGLGTVVTSRQKYRKRYCSNPTSEDSKKFQAALVCMMDKNFAGLREADIVFEKTANALVVNNYDDAATELKQFCCMVHRHRRNLIDTALKGCSEHKEKIEDFVNGFAGSELEVVCEDEDKMLNKICPTLPDPLKEAASKKTNNTSNMRGGLASLYLFSTLGEKDD